MYQAITTDDKYVVTRCSRWIKIQRNDNVNKNNLLYDFSMDGYGYHPHEKEYNKESGTFLDYFRFNGRKYAIDQFVTLGSVACADKPYQFIDTNGKTTFVSAVDFYGDLYDPLYIELDEYGEHVRVYTVERNL